MYLTEPEPAYGAPLAVAAGVRRIVAANPGPMTYHGTNTYLIDEPGGTVVLDPGPDDARHVAAVLAATAGTPVAAILVSHRHRDHVGAVAALRAATGAPVVAYGLADYGSAAADADALEPDRLLAHGAWFGDWQALHTPGHAADHLAFARGDGTVLSGDHVMSWSSSVVSPPDGDMTDYIASLRLMLARDDRLYLPGHGPALAAPGGFVQALLDHRLAREAAVLAALGGAPSTPEALVVGVYGAIAERLRAPAARNVLAHLIKLERDGRAARDGAGWVAR